MLSSSPLSALGQVDNKDGGVEVYNINAAAAAGPQSSFNSDFALSHDANEQPKKNSKETNQIDSTFETIPLSIVSFLPSIHNDPRTIEELLIVITDMTESGGKTNGK